MSNQEKVTILTPVGRLINHSLWEKDTFVDSRGHEAVPSYKVELAFEPDDLNDFEDAVVAAAVAMWGEEAEANYDDNKIKSPIIEGDKLADERESRGKIGDAYRGKLIMRAKTIFNRDGNDSPGGVYVCGPDEKELDFSEHGKVYNGCYGRVSVMLNAYEGIAGGQDGVSLYLGGFQLSGQEGERLRSNEPSSLFSPLMGEGSTGKGRRARGKK